MASKLILIDYQNIQDFTGIRQLGKSVVCEIFMGPNQKISGKQFLELEYATWAVKVVQDSGKNAADRQIESRLVELLDEFDEFYVLSKDKGFNSIVTFISTKPGKRIKRIENFSAENFRKN